MYLVSANNDALPHNSIALRKYCIRYIEVADRLENMLAYAGMTSIVNVYTGLSNEHTTITVLTGKHVCEIDSIYLSIYIHCMFVHLFCNIFSVLIFNYFISSLNGYNNMTIQSTFDI